MFTSLKHHLRKLRGVFFFAFFVNTVSTLAYMYIALRKESLLWQVTRVMTTISVTLGKTMSLDGYHAGS